MRKVIAQHTVSANGVMEAPGGVSGIANWPLTGDRCRRQAAGGEYNAVLFRILRS